MINGSLLIGSRMAVKGLLLNRFSQRCQRMKLLSPLMMRYWSNDASSTTTTTTTSSSDKDASGKAGEPVKTTVSGNADADAKVEEWKQKYIFLLADMENLRERTKREVSNASQFAIQKFARDVIGISDILELALANCPGHLALAEEEKEKVYSNEKAQRSAGHAISAIDDSPMDLKNESESKNSLNATVSNDDNDDDDDSINSMHKVEEMYRGVQMTLEETKRVLERNGVLELLSLGNRFDPALHEALYQVPPSPKVASGLIVSVAKKGYTLNGRILRPAQVGVSL